MTFFLGHKNRSTLACVERQWGIPRALISDGAPLFVAQERNVSEETLYNAIVGESHSCPGSPLHALVSSHTATNDVICHPLQKTHTLAGEIFLKLGAFKMNLFKNQWVQKNSKQQTEKQLWILLGSLGFFVSRNYWHHIYANILGF